MTRPTRLPQLSELELQEVARRLQLSNISAEGQRLILASLNAAANPLADSPELNIQTLPEPRRSMLLAAIQDILQSIGYNVVLDPGLLNEEYLAEIERRRQENAQGDDSGVLAALLALLLPLVRADAQIAVDATQELYNTLLQQRIQQWQVSMAEQAASCGCPGKPIPAPSGNDLAELERLSRRDVDSIFATQEREAQAFLERLVNEKPNEPPEFYVQAYQEWFQNRLAYKAPSIALTAAQDAYFLAQKRFVEMNQFETRYRLVGPPPVCPICTDLWTQGSVDQATKDSQGAPIHINCPHTWQIVDIPSLSCDIMWVG